MSQPRSVLTNCVFLQSVMLLSNIGAELEYIHFRLVHVENDRNVIRSDQGACLKGV